MGGAISRRFSGGASGGGAYDAAAAGVGAATKKRAQRFYDSGELSAAPPRAKVGAGRFSEASMNFGKASISGFGKAMDVLDTLGSGMSNLNPNSGFLNGTAIRGYKVSILAFEVANTIAKASMLWRSLFDDSIKDLKRDILQSDGIRLLISSDVNELLHVMAVDKRDELSKLCSEVIRFGDMCKNPIWHNLGRYFEKLNSKFPPEEPAKEEIEATMQQLIDQAQNTAELYHELHALNKYEQDLQRKFHEGFVPSAKTERLIFVHGENDIKHQRKLVVSLKKKSLWSKSLEEVVEKLVDVVTSLHQQIGRAFNYAGKNLTSLELHQSKRLGTAGLALHYANTISQIENIVPRPLTLSPSARDNLYQGLPPSVKSALRRRLQPDHGNEYTVSEIKAEMEKILRWISPMAENTIRLHQGFGCVGEWANYSTVTTPSLNKKQPQQQYDIPRIQTLYHADKDKTEHYILELVVWLHRLVLQARKREFENKSLRHAPATLGNVVSLASGSPNQIDSNADTLTVVTADDSNGELLQLAMASNGKVRHRRSNSWPGSVTGSVSVDGKPGRKARVLVRMASRSCDSSPVRKYRVRLDMQLQRSRSLDMMDGLELPDLSCF